MDMTPILLGCIRTNNRDVDIHYDRGTVTMSKDGNTIRVIRGWNTLNELVIQILVYMDGMAPNFDHTSTEYSDALALLWTSLMVYQIPGQIVDYRPRVKMAEIRHAIPAEPTPMYPVAPGTLIIGLELWTDGIEIAMSPLTNNGMWRPTVWIPNDPMTSIQTPFGTITTGGNNGLIGLSLLKALAIGLGTGIGVEEVIQFTTIMLNAHTRTLRRMDTLPRDANRVYSGDKVMGIIWAVQDGWHYVPTPTFPANRSFEPHSSLINCILEIYDSEDEEAIQ